MHMNSRIAKKLTVTLFEVLDYNNSYFKYKMALKPNIGDFVHGIDKIEFLDVIKLNNRLLFVARERVAGVAQESCYKYLFERFGGIHNVEVNIPAAIVKITGDKTFAYKLFVDSDYMQEVI